MADHAALGREWLEIERDVEPRGGEDAGQRPADLQRLDLTVTDHPAGQLLAQLTDRHPERNLVDARFGKALVEADQLRSRGRARAERR